MTDRPILFSAPMVRALLAGRKTQTRRLLKPQPPAWIYPGDKPGYSCLTPRGHIEFRGCYIDDDGVDHGPASKFVKLAFQKGDRLWVKETWQVGMTDDGPCVAYRADSNRIYPEFTGPSEGAGPTFDYDAHPAKAWRHGHWIADVEARGPWSSTLHMPRWASRLTLTVTDVRVQRLQDCSEADAMAEGVIEYEPTMEDPAEFSAFEGTDVFNNAVSAYHDLWNRINGAGAWEANPWVVAVTFKVREGNIDG